MLTNNVATGHEEDDYDVQNFPPVWIKVWANGGTVPTGILIRELQYWLNYWERSDED